jgi:hypothetical protein
MDFTTELPFPQFLRAHVPHNGQGNIGTMILACPLGEASGLLRHGF